MRIVLIAVLVLIGAASTSCAGGGSCGLQLKQRVCFPVSCESPSIAEMPCCGASMYQDLNLPIDDVQVDLINTSGTNGRVDAFLTDGTCAKLFSGSYTGAATSPLCTIYIGPVGPGGPSQRKSIRRGKYRVFEQAYTTNPETVRFLMEVGLWSEACRWSPVTP